MPHIEVIPITSGAAPAPGWAYVPDTGYDPSKAAINPTGRKRTARQDIGGSTHDLSARQQTALHKRISELDRDTQKEVSLPARAKEGSGSTPRERAGRKMTPAVRKILQSGRTFAHWLADEEALNAQRPAGGGGLGGGSGGGHSSSAAQTAAASPAPSSSAAGPSAAVAATAAQNSRSRKTLASRTKRSGSTAAVPSSPATPSAQAPPSSANNTAAPSPAAAQPPVDVELLDAPPPAEEEEEEEEDPLLRPVVPVPPSAQEIQALLAHSPLPYGAARVAPPDPEGPPRRQFCEICGYWGRIKCLKCAARVCGLECKRAHDETSCLRM